MSGKKTSMSEPSTAKRSSAPTSISAPSAKKARKGGAAGLVGMAVAVNSRPHRRRIPSHAHAWRSPSHRSLRFTAGGSASRPSLPAYLHVVRVHCFRNIDRKLGRERLVRGRSDRPDAVDGLVGHVGAVEHGFEHRRVDVSGARELSTVLPPMQ